MRVRIDLAYDGTGFHGFARQPGLPTVQGTLEGALSRVCGLVHGRPDDPAVPLVSDRIATTCAGRTDAGVHALGQVVHVDLDPSWSPATARSVAFATEDPDVLVRRLDDLVGHPITIWSVAVVDGGFDARFTATERRYRYVLTDRPAVDPRGRHLRWDLGEPLDVPAMHEAIQHLRGEHDFASLCRRSEGRHTLRRIDAAAVTRGPSGGVVEPAPGSWAAGLDDAVHVTLRGPAFCHQQVRSTTGCLVEVGTGRRPPTWVAEVLAARDRSVAARVAPPDGLTLESVAYPDPWPDSPPDADPHPVAFGAD
ncbi:tRNA pseudouridine(38-40) synthase TruA [Nitriliruptoria bacterium AS10]|nr:tRNA pseudouridine(38-40) synthase TruA [Salsipaludibacter albus]